MNRVQVHLLSWTSNYALKYVLAHKKKFLIVLPPKTTMCINLELCSSTTH
jgi:hypothetical protein